MKQKKNVTEIRVWKDLAKILCLDHVLLDIIQWPVVCLHRRNVISCFSPS